MVEYWTGADDSLIDEASAVLWEIDQERLLETTEEELIKDIEGDIEGIDRIIPTDVLPIGFSSSSYFPDSHTQMIEHQIEIMLKRMYEEIETKWHLRQPTGKIHVPTMMKTRAIGVPSVRIFRRRERSSVEQAKMGIFFCIDCSGSMRGSESIGGGDYKRRIDIAKDAVWAMGTAFEKMESFVAVATFAYLKDTQYVKEFGKAGWWDFSADGENSPHIALQWGESLLRRIKIEENVENLMLIVMADGGWMSSDESIESAKKAASQFKRLNSEGVIETMEIHVGMDSVDEGSWLSPKHKIIIKDFSNFPRDLGVVMQGIQRGIVRKLME